MILITALGVTGGAGALYALYNYATSDNAPPAPPLPMDAFCYSKIPLTSEDDETEVPTAPPRPPTKKPVDSAVRDRITHRRRFTHPTRDPSHESTTGSTTRTYVMVPPTSHTASQNEITAARGNLRHVDAPNRA